MLRFTGKCDNQKFCSYPQDTCMIGHSCETDLSVSRSACMPGEYLLNGLCQKCPAGFYCSDGNTVLACPQGKVCDSIGMDAPNVLCPYGQMCDINTVSKYNQEYITYDFNNSVWKPTLILTGTNELNVFDCISVKLHIYSNKNEVSWIIFNQFANFTYNGSNENIDCIVATTHCYNISVTDNGHNGFQGSISVLWNLQLVVTIIGENITSNANASFCKPNYFAQGE